MFYATYQALILSAISVYDYKWTKYYYSFMPVSHGIFVALKALSLLLKLPNYADVSYFELNLLDGFFVGCFYHHLFDLSLLLQQAD